MKMSNPCVVKPGINNYTDVLKTFPEKFNSHMVQPLPFLVVIQRKQTIN